MKYKFPSETYGENCVLVPIDKALIPFVSGALNKFFERGYWKTYDYYQSGYNAFAELLSNMQNNCLEQLIESNNRLYRLLDASLNGTQYVASSPDPETGAITVSPPVPAAPPASTDAENALRAHVGRLWQLAENSVNGKTFAAGAGIESSPILDDSVSTRETLRAMQGVINAGWFGIGGQPATMADIVTSLKLASEDDKEKIFTALDAIVGASSGATIFNTVRGLFTDSADLGLEGAQFAVTLVSSMGQIINNTLLGNQIDRLIRTLDGGGFIGPEDNILQALRGDEPASAERNVIDAGGAGAPDYSAVLADILEALA